MTTSIKIRTNGDYVCELFSVDKNGGLVRYGSAGPGNNAESDWIGLPANAVIKERTATWADKRLLNLEVAIADRDRIIAELKEQLAIDDAIFKQNPTVAPNRHKPIRNG